MNKSGDCTMCCDIFPVKWLNKPANTICKYCDKGCTIHDAKQSECTDFNCAYIQMEAVHIDLRPDKCGVIFEKITRRIFIGTYNPKKEKSIIAAKQIKSFFNQGISVIMISSMQDKKPEILLSKGHILKYIQEEFENHLIKRYGSS